jgi:hypothetical protein
VLSVKGTPDLVGAVKMPEGYAIWLGVECKVPKTTTRSATHLNPDQQAFHAFAKEFNMLCIVARSVEDVDAALAQIGVFRV